MMTGELRIRVFALIAALALCLGLGVAGPANSAAAAADSGASVSALAGNDAATLSDDEYHHCLEADYGGRVFMKPCRPMGENYPQQWQGVGKTLVNVQTGFCLDGNEAGAIYTQPCDPARANPYQEWQRSTTERAIFNPKTTRALSADESTVIGGAYLDLDRQHWTATGVDGACEIEPLAMVIDNAEPETSKDLTAVHGSPPRLAGRWQFTVQLGRERTETATWNFNAGIDFAVKNLKVAVGGEMGKSISEKVSISESETFNRIVPQGQQMFAAYAVNYFHGTFHWHRSAKDCTNLDSGQYRIDAPRYVGFRWSCETAIDPDCRGKIEEAQKLAPQADEPAVTKYWYDPSLYPEPDPGPNPPAPEPTSVTYTGPRSAPYHRPFVASARVTSGDSAVNSGTVRFSLGGASCTTGPNSSGIAACQLTPTDVPGPKTLQVHYSGSDRYEPSSTSVDFTILKLPTNLIYTGVKRVANGEPAELSGRLTEGETGTTPVKGRTVQLALGTGATKQSCNATTDEQGSAHCAIASVDQPLNAEATVPVTAEFGGDAYYYGSRDSATARLEYYTGQAVGLTGSVRLPLISLNVGPTPDTGPVRTASASKTGTPCAASAGTLLVSADALCPEVSTSLAPGTVTAKAEIQKVHVGLPGIPVIDISGATATSKSTCTGATGSAKLNLTVAGLPVTVPTAPNSTVSLPGGGRIIVNEQSPVAGADTGLKVNAAHIVVPGLTGNLVDLTVGTAVSGAHNCH